MEKEKEIEKKKYPIGAEHYTMYEEVGNGGTATVHRALCNSLNEIVAIKIFDCERSNCDLNNISREIQTMVLVDHPNVVKSHCSFVSDHNLWIVMPYMSGGSCLHILKAAHPNGFEEVAIATILREVLKGLDYLHQHGHIHRDVKAGNILIDARGAVKLGDFGVSACLFDSGDRQRTRNTFVGTPCWMAPEVMEQLHGYDFKADIWSFGITALELAHGHAPFSKYPPMKVLLMTLQNAPPGLDYETDKKFSKSFRQMIASCLVKDPSKRPSAKSLSKHSFFKQAKSNDYILRTLLEGMPALGDHLEALKRQEKMPDEEKEEISQNEYNRGISSWNFNLEDMKAQASLIQDDDTISEKDVDMQCKQLQHQSSFSKHFSPTHQSIVGSQHSDAADSDDNGHAPLSSVDSITNTARSEKSDDDVRVSGIDGKPVLDVHKKSSDGAPTSSSSSPRDKVQNHSQNLSSSGITNLQKIDNSHPEIICKGSKISVNGDEGDEKPKHPVVRQKGRFKVTSDNVEMEKVVPAPLMSKSHSMQVIGQHPAIVSPMPSHATSSNPLAHALYPTLQSLLQTNIIQRDDILSLMKKIAHNDSAENGYTTMDASVTERSLLEAANDREKELLGEITDLQRRLIRAQEELQKYKTGSKQVKS